VHNLFVGLQLVCSC